MAVSLFARQYPEALRTSESEKVDASRRERTKEQTSGARHHIGLAFSGGGIRSATFCLGVIQALAAKNDRKTIGLRDIDFLSTVSGGSYIGAFLGAMFCRPKKDATKTTADEIEEELQHPDCRPVHWLRENGRYLAPNGTGDNWLNIATILRNWAAIVFVLGALMLLVLMSGHAAERAIRMHPVSLTQYILPALSLQWDNIYWSPFLPLALAALVFLAVPCGWTYWLGSVRPGKGEYLWIWALTLLALLAGFCGGWHGSWRWGALAFVSAETIAYGLWLSFRPDGASRGGATASRRFRNRSSRTLNAMVVLTAAVLGVALIDTIGRNAYMYDIWRGSVGLPVSFVSAVGVLLTVARKFIAYMASDDRKKRFTIPLGVIGSLAGVVVVVLLLGALSAASYLLARPVSPNAECAGRPPSAAVSLSTRQHVVVGMTKTCDPQPVPFPDERAYWFTLGLAALTWLLGRSLPFVNLSSLTQFYSARLSRTYVGASNAKRQSTGKTATEEVTGDDLEMSAYEPEAHGGPLHFINVTLNETVGGVSQVLDRDRKGLSMAIGPAAVSVGVTQHARWKENSGKTIINAVGDPKGVRSPFHIWPDGTDVTPKALSLSQWTGISGAAVATGMGAQTRLGLSLLLGLANVRLGYWWFSGVDPSRQGGTRPGLLHRMYAWLLPVQSALTDELLAQFRGPHGRYWYLTDGGHFENTAAYELIRRRVPIILICDDGEDSHYSFDDLANLVRKARIDFDAEIEFIDGLDEVRPKDMLSRQHLLTAVVTYPDGEEAWPRFLDPAKGDDGTERTRSLILVLKPSLTGDEPLDVLQYAASNRPFPQQSTVDQFFDEAQWEAYRRLGQHIGEQATTRALTELKTLVAAHDAKRRP